MLKNIFFVFLILVCQCYCLRSFGQQKDSVTVAGKRDSTKNLLSQDTEAKKFNPKKATFRSAIIPGWGQAYNKKYWKIPLVYGALGTTAAVYFFNVKTYKALKQAYIYISDTIPSNDALIDKRFKNLSPESIRTYRNSFRQNVDYSVLFF